MRSCVSRVVWRTRVIENVECYARLAPVMTYRASGQAKNSREQLQRNPAFRKRRPKGDVNASAARPARRRRSRDYPARCQANSSCGATRIGMAPKKPTTTATAATANALLMQFQSDMLGKEVTLPKVAETTALGAAFAAGLAVGVWV